MRTEIQRQAEFMGYEISPAAIEAGIVPQVKTIRISEKTTGRDLAQKLKQELSPEVLAELAAELAQEGRI